MDNKNINELKHKIQKLLLELGLDNRRVDNILAQTDNFIAGYYKGYNQAISDFNKPQNEKSN